MGLVYVYVVAWVLGGVVLGARLLLTHREPDALAPHMQSTGSARTAHAASLVATALVGFGLFGLLAEGMGFSAAPWTVAEAVAVAGLLASAGHLLTRVRTVDPLP